MVLFSNVSNPDDGTCELHTTQATCVRPKSEFSGDQSKCYWQDEKCYFVQPGASINIIIFVAFLSALLSIPGKQ